LVLKLLRWKCEEATADELAEEGREADSAEEDVDKHRADQDSKTARATGVPERDREASREILRADVFVFVFAAMTARWPRPRRDAVEGGGTATMVGLAEVWTERTNVVIVVENGSTGLDAGNGHDALGEIRAGLQTVRATDCQRPAVAATVGSPVAVDAAMAEAVNWRIVIGWRVCLCYTVVGQG
jgi:hypothetical protein